MPTPQLAPGKKKSQADIEEPKQNTSRIGGAFTRGEIGESRRVSRAHTASGVP
jgi:hypothetical protein